MKDKKVILFIILVNLFLISSIYAKVDTSWVNRYNNPANDSDYARAMVVDAAGNVYVTGSTKGATGFDFLTIKYNTSGVEQWQRIRDNSNDNDYAYAIAVDGSGNVYVTGASYSNATAYDYMTIKYNSIGTRQWERFYDGPGSGNDEARAIAVDGSGNVYVTGFSVGSGTNDDYSTVKYDALGNFVWASRFNCASNLDDRASGLVLRSDTVYVTGYSDSSDTGRDYLTEKILPDGSIAWVRRYGLAGPDYANAIAIDNLGNVYITGQYSSNTTSNYATIKYNSIGTMLWATQYYGRVGNYWDIATAIAVDASYNCYVTGYSDGSGTNYDFATIKYNSLGVAACTLRYNSPGNGDDRATGIAVSNLGYIYVTGQSNGSVSGYDYATIKYRASNGQGMWITRYDGASGPDQANAIAVDATGNTYVTGGSYTATTSVDYATIKYRVVRDMGVVSIVRPNGTIDSTASYTPQARIKNYGSESDSARVTFTINGWTNTQNVLNVAPDSEYVVNFGAWAVGPRGSYTTRCSTYLADDAVSSNDTMAGSFTVRVRDVGTDVIIQPTGLVDSTVTITPRAKIKNYGTVPVTFNTKFRISDGVTNYIDDSIITINNGDSLTVDFAPWTVVTDTFTAKCSTEYSNDIVVSNDKKEATFRVVVHNIGIAEIISPDANVDSTSAINPFVRLVNAGTETETFNIWFMIYEAGYANMKTISVSPLKETIIDFPAWTVGPRGTYTTKCSTALGNDMVAANNFLSGSFNIVVHNVGAVAVIQPIGTIDSVAQLIPQAKIKNIGTQSETFNVKFSIIGSVTTWSDDTIVSLNNADSLTINFAPWSTSRGSYEAKCSTELVSDMVNSNDKSSSLFDIRVYDYGVNRITAPAGEIDSGSTITPKAWVYNYGTTNETNVPVLFYIIGSSYSNTQLVSLNAGDSVEVTFDSYDAHISRGIHAMRCTTQMNSDLKPDNNVAVSTLLIRFYDVSVLQIINPSGNCDSTATILPQAIVKNYGTRDETFNVTFRIGAWSSTKEVSALPPGEEELVVFNPWTVMPRGYYTCQCSTELADDILPTNDKYEGNFTVIVKDYSVSALNPVNAIIDYGTTITPQAWIHNYGTTDEINIPVVYYIAGTSYSDLQNISLVAGDSILQSFDDFLATVPEGEYIMRCSTQLSGDIVVVNDFATTTISVIIPGWTLQDSVPVERGIKAGAALTALGNTIYGLQGNNLNHFYAYNTGSDEWSMKAEVPFYYRLDGYLVTKKVKAGGSLTAHNGLIYAFKGNNTCEFWRYYPIGDTWSMKEFIPEYASGINVTKKTRVKAGGALITLGDSIYAFKGGNTNEFWVYDIASDTWCYKRPIITENGKKIKGGGALTVMGCTLYCFTGGNTYNFYAYIPELDTWIKKRDAIFGSFKTFKRKIKDGAGLVELNRKIYALKGGNTKDFGFYNLVTDTWYTLDTIYGVKRIKDGGAIVAKGCSLYAFKGANTNEFWRYTPSVSMTARAENSGYQAVQNSINPNPGQYQNFNITTNPLNKTLLIQYHVMNLGLVTIKLYNTDGRLIQTFLNDIQQPGNQTFRTTTEKLSAGVYFIRYKDNAVESNHKIVIR